MQNQRRTATQRRVGGSEPPADTTPAAATDVESVTFVDAGAVADKPGLLKAKVGLGAGVRWRSPVGPVQADVAYGVDIKKFRLHLRLGFTF